MEVLVNHHAKTKSTPEKKCGTGPKGVVVKIAKTENVLTPMGSDCETVEASIEA